MYIYVFMYICIYTYVHMYMYIHISRMRPSFYGRRAVPDVCISVYVVESEFLNTCVFNVLICECVCILFHIVI